MDALQRIIRQALPELEFLTPRLAVVTSITESREDDAASDWFRPIHAVNCRLLDQNGRHDDAHPEIFGVPLSMTGNLARPVEGSIIVVSWVNGSPAFPIVSSVLAVGQEVPGLSRNESVRAMGGACERMTGMVWERSTPGTFQEISQSRVIDTDGIIENAGTVDRDITGSVSETVGGSCTTEVMGKLTMRAGAGLRLLSLAQAEVVAGGNLNFVTGGKIQTISTDDQVIESRAGRITLKNAAGSLAELLDGMFSKLETIIQKITELTVVADGKTSTTPVNSAEFLAVQTELQGLKVQTDLILGG